MTVQSTKRISKTPQTGEGWASDIFKATSLSYTEQTKINK